MSPTELENVIGIDKDKCINCHLCINACPVKYCNDGSGDVVSVNHNMCIACGNCLTACTHDARFYVDDIEKLFVALEKKERIVAIVAPSIAANFPKQYLNLNGYLKSIGIEAIFDVSFGAELTVASYLNYINTENPQTVIAQPCAAIVTYIEIYQPELLQYLAPVDSPMLHTMKLIQNFYTEFKEHKIAVISPCIAKKREFSETGVGDYNISFLSLQNHISNTKTDLSQFEKTGYDNPPAERAVLFSSPGGLMQTAERWIPEIRNNTRKIEGVHSIYNYLETLPRMIEEKKSPLLIDCLNCEKGCNGGPLTLVKDAPVDEIEHWIAQRNIEVQNYYKEKSISVESSPEDHLEKLLKDYWTENLYTREYKDCSGNNYLKIPNEEQLNDIYRSMHKYSKEEIYNCSSCGYNRCELMAKAIFNGLNKPENCHFYLQEEGVRAHIATQKSQKRMHTILKTMIEGFIQLDRDSIIQDFNNAATEIFAYEKLEEMSLISFIDNSYEEFYLANREELIEKKSISYELVIKAKDGIEKICEFNETILINDNKHIGSFAIISDITEKKKAELALEKSRDELEDKVIECTKALSETVEELKQAEEEITAQRDEVQEKAANLEQAMQMLKQSQSQLIEAEKMAALGQLIAGVAHEINTPLGAIRSSVGNITSSLEQVLTKLPDFFKSLSEQENEAFFTMLETSINNSTTVTSKEERRYRRKLTSELDDANIHDADDIADTLVDIGIYELSEAFMHIITSDNNIDILTMAYKLSGLLKSSKTISIATDRASKVVFALKNFAHYNHTGEKNKANIINLIETVLTLYHNQLKQGVDVVKQFEDIPDILCFPDELNQVWTNLIHNSIQAMDNKGTITITVQVENNENIVVAISDTGKGIPPEITDKIFNPFFTTKPQGEGSGLGLDIVKRIVEKHDGTISFDSIPGKTTFFISLPINV